MWHRHNLGLRPFTLLKDYMIINRNSEHEKKILSKLTFILREVNIIF